MIGSNSHSYWFARFFFCRGLFLTYFLAFLVAYRQFIPLCGSDGIQPFPDFLNKFDGFWDRPSLLHFFQTDEAVKIISLSGLILSLIGFSGIEWLGSLPLALNLLVVWVLYLSLVKGGGIFYGYGWESFLLETGILSVFLGGADYIVSDVMLFLFSWLLFRVMFGAGLIKIRGDQCWRDLTCMDYHYETQPMPNPCSWFAHHLPGWFHKIEVLGNHIVELVIPVFYFLPQPYSGMAGVITILFQAWLMVTGNFSWLNFLTAVVAVLLIPDYFFVELLPTAGPSQLVEIPLYHELIILLYALVVFLLSYWPTKNMLSKRQVMNAGFDPFSLVNTYGAFGSITKDRYELVVQGRHRGDNWKTYKFKGKPTDPKRRPPQWAPYHLRLDWQMWFAAMRRRPRYWLMKMVKKLLENDGGVTSLLRDNPFSETEPPNEIRIIRYRYEYSKFNELRNNSRWWNREFVSEFLSPTSHESTQTYL